MLRCNEVTRLYSSDEVRHSSLRKRLAVRVHLMMCRSCRRYVKELEAIGDAIRRATLDAPEAPERLEALVRHVLPNSKAPEQ